MAGILVSADSQIIDSGGNLAFVDGGTYSHLAQSIAPTKTYRVVQIQLSLLKAGSPGGSIQIHIRADSGGNPGSSITNGDSATVDPSTLSTGTGFITFTFTSYPKIVSGTTYHIELTHSGAVFDVSNTVGWSKAGSSVYANGAYEFQINSGGWNTGADDFAWKIYRLPDAILGGEI